MKLKRFGTPRGKLKVLLGIKVGRLYDFPICYRTDSRSDVARLLINFRHARREVKRLHSSLAFNLFEPYTLRWVVVHACEIYIINEDDCAKIFRFNSAISDAITDTVN